MGMGLLLTASAFGGEGLFSRTYTTETVPATHWELEQMIRNRSERSFGEYSAFDFSTEFEYGITNNFQMAVYLNSGFVHAKGAPDDDDPNGATGFSRDRTFLQGISTEFIYRIFSPVTDAVGLALYFEPEVYFNDPHNGLTQVGATCSTSFRVSRFRALLRDATELFLEHGGVQRHRLAYARSERVLSTNRDSYSLRN